MEPYMDVFVSYLVGTIAGIWLFKRYIQEGIIQQTIDTLVKEDFCRAYVNEDGEHELHKWYELDDVFEEIVRLKETEQLIQEAVELQEQMWESDEDEKDDSA